MSACAHVSGILGASNSTKHSTLTKSLVPAFRLYGRLHSYLALGVNNIASLLVISLRLITSYEFRNQKNRYKKPYIKSINLLMYRILYLNSTEGIHRNKLAI